jgi:TPR repeat protein
MMVAIFLENSEFVLKKESAPPKVSRDEFDLSADELDSLRASVSSDHGQSAYKLFLYYLYSRNDQNKAKEWCKRAAELGDSRAQKAYTSFYNNEPPLNRSDLSGK